MVVGIWTGGSRNLVRRVVGIWSVPWSEFGPDRSRNLVLGWSENGPPYDLQGVIWNDLVFNWLIWKEMIVNYDDAIRVDAVLILQILD
jgi:hypothetical protein